MKRLIPILFISLLLLGSTRAGRFQWNGNSNVTKIEYVKHRSPFVLYEAEKVRASITNMTEETQTFDVAISLTDLTHPDFNSLGTKNSKLTLPPRQAKEIVVDVPVERDKPYGLFEARVEVSQDGKPLNFAITTYGYGDRPAKIPMDAESPFATWLCSRGWINEEGEPEIFGNTDFSHFKTIGINNVRGFCSGWGGVERKKGTFDFRLPDLFVAHLHRADVGATGILAGPPKWASSTPVITDQELRKKYNIAEDNKRLFSIREGSHYANAMPKDLDEFSIGKILQMIIVPPDSLADETTVRLFQGFKELSGCSVKARPTANGYAVELALPWTNVGDIQPRPGIMLRIDYSLNDADPDCKDGKRKAVISWQGKGKTYMTTDNYGCLMLGGQ